MPLSITSNVATSNRKEANTTDNWIAGDLVTVYSSAIRAIEENNYLEFNYILEKNYLTTLLDKDSLGSLLLKAIETNAHLSISIALINLGCCNVNFRGPEQLSTPLMMAARNDNKQLLNLLLNCGGVKINVADKYGWTALFYASYFGRVECARLLLEHGAHVQLVDCDKMSCLTWSAGRGHADVVELLIKFGVNVNALDGYHTSALIWACRKGNTKIVKILLENGASINERGMYGWTPLIVAVKNNHLETTKLLLDYNPNLNTCDSELMSPLMIACKEGFGEIALELIKSGAIVNQSDNQGNTPLIYAAMMKNHQIVKALVKAGAYIEHSGLGERNAIHWSIIRNDVDSCKLFLEHGIDTKFKTISDETYLMLAAKHCSWDVIKLLELYEN